MYLFFSELIYDGSSELKHFIRYVQGICLYQILFEKKDLGFLHTCSEPPFDKLRIISPKDDI